MEQRNKERQRIKNNRRETRKKGEGGRAKIKEGKNR